MFAPLIELSAIIAEYGLRIELLPRHPRSNDVVAHLHSGLASGRIHSDRQAIAELQELGFAQDAESFVVTKSRLKRRMLNSVLFLDLRPQKNSEQTIRFFRVQRRLAQLKVLLRLGAERNVLLEARKGYAIALKYDLTVEALEFAVMLRGYYCRSGDRRRFEQFSASVETLSQRYRAEQTAVDAYQRFGVYYIKRVSYAERTDAILRSSIETVRALRADHHSSVIEIVYYRLLIYSFDMRAQYEDVYRVATEAIAYLEMIPGIATKSDFAEFALYQLSSCVHTRDLQKGIAASAACVSYYLEGTFNWFVSKELTFVFYMHLQHFDSARDALRDVLGHRNYVLLPEYQQQRWKVYELYLLFATGELRHMLSKKTKRGVALRELLASAPEIKGDRAGFGFSIRLIYILYLIEKGSFDELTESIESFRTFVGRYIKASEYPRSSSFAKLITLVERYSYNYLIVKTKGRKYLERMQTVGVSHTEANENIQILPYELIWEMVLESLRKHQRVRRGDANHAGVGAAR